MTTKAAAGALLVLPIDDVVPRLINSANVNDQRKGHDLQQLQWLSANAWARMFSLTGAMPGPRRMLHVFARLRVAGLLWEGEPRLHDDWRFALGIPHSYPLAEPLVTFVDGPTPFNGHVLHGDFLPNREGMAPELQHFLNVGANGICCYALAGDWSTALDHNLALVVRQVSRILTGLQHGERYSLNEHARDYLLRMAEEGRLPLGPALPIPGNVDRVAQDTTRDDAREEAVEWLGMRDSAGRP